jgi:CRP/FNR family transcriptional regulator, cyclic AMP receptor protein
MTGYEPLLVERDWNRTDERDWAKVLSGLPLFAKVSKRRLRKIAADAEVREFAPGETVVAAGAPPDWFYVVLSGEAKVAGKPASRALGLGDYFGEIALLDGEPRSANVVATDDLHVLRMPKHSFLELLEEEGVAAKLLAELGGRVRRLEHQS